MTITGLRHLITELRPAALDEYGLGAAVEALVQRVAATSGLEIIADISLYYEQGVVKTRHEEEIESTLYRLVQEGLNNAARHAEARLVDISVLEDDHDVIVEIRDDGRGFEPDTRRSGFGLKGMHERVALVGGTLDALRHPESGRRSLLAFPAANVGRRTCLPSPPRPRIPPDASDCLGQIDELMGQRISDKLGPGGTARLALDVRSVRLHRPH